MFQKKWIKNKFCFNKHQIYATLKTAFIKTQLKFVSYEYHKRFQQNHFEKNMSNALQIITLMIIHG